METIKPMDPTTALLKETEALFAKARGFVFKGIANLWLIRENKLHAGYHSFSEYVEEALTLDRGQVSRWLTSYEHFVVKGGVEPSQLESVNPERLYQARLLPGTVLKQLTAAKTLTKSELRYEVKNSGGDCKHEEIIKICAKCHQRV